jgi:hypothetical protein
MPQLRLSTAELWCSPRGIVRPLSRVRNGTPTPRGSRSREVSAGMIDMSTADRSW